MLLGVVAHLDDVALQRIEIEHQTGGLDIRLVHADGGRDVVADFQVLGLFHQCSFHCLLPDLF